MFLFFPVSHFAVHRFDKERFRTHVCRWSKRYELLSNICLLRLIRLTLRYFCNFLCSFKGLLNFIVIGQILRSSTLVSVYADNICHQTHCTSFQQFIFIFLCSWYLKAFVCSFITLIDCCWKLTYDMPVSTSLSFEVLINTRHMPKRKSPTLSFTTFSVLNSCHIFIASS